MVENHKKYRERIELYKRFGYDVEREREFILDKSCPLYGDILEVGTGKGYFTLALAKEGYRFTSVDISAEEQKFARLNIEYYGLGEKVNFQIADAEHLPFQDRQFDIVFCVNMFHHLEDPFPAGDELARVTSFEGKVVLSDFNREGLKLVDEIHRSEGRRHPASRFDLNHTAAYLAGKGFRLEKYATKFQDLIIAFHPII
ncbi:MAG: class I SAM-dependent methyltransferase [Candidatus Omnitrophica bacterium]|nr:class I SAM-dependent methyltransferase [Candidatus Omnitrophota bacterium]